MKHQPLTINSQVDWYQYVNTKVKRQMHDQLLAPAIPAWNNFKLVRDAMHQQIQQKRRRLA